MTPLSNLTSRNLLIAIHDALATTLAVLASFYLRFEGDRIAEGREYNDTNLVREVFLI